MSAANILRASLFGTLISGSLFALHKTDQYLQKNYSPKVKIYEIGEKINGKIVIGYFGAAEKVFQNLNPKLPLYFGSAKVAQSYASGHKHKGLGEPQFAAVLGDRFPKTDDLGPPRFIEGPEPLKELWNERGFVAYNPQTVDKNSKVGRVANLIRFFDSLNNKNSSKS